MFKKITENIASLLDQRDSYQVQPLHTQSTESALLGMQGGGEIQVKFYKKKQSFTCYLRNYEAYAKLCIFVESYQQRRGSKKGIIIMWMPVSESWPNRQDTLWKTKIKQKK